MRVASFFTCGILLLYRFVFIFIGLGFNYVLVMFFFIHISCCGATGDGICYERRVELFRAWLWYPYTFWSRLVVVWHDETAGVLL